MFIIDDTHSDLILKNGVLMCLFSCLLGFFVRLVGDFVVVVVFWFFFFPQNKITTGSWY